MLNSNGNNFEKQPKGIGHGTQTANTVPITIGFPDANDDNDESDFDSPTPGFASIPEAIEDIRQGKVDTPPYLLFALSSSL